MSSVEKPKKQKKPKKPKKPSKPINKHLLKFLIWFSKFFSPNLFVDLKKIDPEQEGLLNFCPICSEKLSDKKVLTFKTHEKEKHDLTDTEIIKRYFNRNPFPIIFLFTGAAVGFILLSGAILDAVYPNVDFTAQDSCHILLNNFNMRLFEQKQMIESDLTTFNYLVSNCDLEMNTILPTFREEVKQDKLPIPILGDLLVAKNYTIFNNEYDYKYYKKYTESLLQQLNSTK